MQMLREALGLAPEVSNKPKIINTTDTIPKISRRGFLMGGVAVAGMLGSGSMTSALAAPKRKIEAVNANIEAIKSLQEEARLTNMVPAMNNKEATEHKVYNSLIDLIRDYNSGEFDKDDSKYYRPKEKFKDYNADQIKLLESRNNIKFETITLKADFVVIAEITGTNTSDALDKKGYAVLKKGTEIMCRTYKDKNGVSITENYIKYCFNAIYKHRMLCPPCD